MTNSCCRKFLNCFLLRQYTQWKVVKPSDACCRLERYCCYRDGCGVSGDATLMSTQGVRLEFSNYIHWDWDVRSMLTLVSRLMKRQFPLEFGLLLDGNICSNEWPVLVRDVAINSIQIFAVYANVSWVRYLHGCCSVFDIHNDFNLYSIVQYFYFTPLRYSL